MNNLKVLYVLLISLVSNAVNAQDTIVGLTSPDHFNVDGSDGSYYDTTILRLKVDSSLFNGVWIHQGDFMNNYSITIVFNNYANGKLINSRSENYCVSESLSLEQRKLITNPTIGELFLCGISSTNTDTSTVSFINQQGEIYGRNTSYRKGEEDYSYSIQKKTYMSHFESVEAFSKNWGRDSSYKIHYNYNEIGDTISCTRIEYKHIDTNNYYTYLKMDYGDTSRFETKVNEQITGYRVVQPYYYENENGYFIRSMWDAGELLYFFNKDIIFVDSNMNVISETEFLASFRESNDGFWSYQIQEKYESYRFILYPVFGRFNYSKIKKVIRKRHRMKWN